MQNLKKPRVSLLIGLAVLVLSLFGFWLFSLPSGSEIESLGKEQVSMVMYKDPNCGCCTGYAAELRKNGYQVKVVRTSNMNEIKQQFGVRGDKQSCHTVVAGRYFIEGHVPLEAVKKLLKEQPEIKGIGLPRMPAGSPGMPGVKRGPFEVYQTDGTNYSLYLSV